VRIGVLSDTHLPLKARALPARLLRAFEGVDLILHGGDLVSADVLDLLGRIAPVEAVAGNNDPPELCARLGFRKIVEAGGARLGLVHGHRGRGRNTPDRAAHAFRREPAIAAVVFGHSHLPLLAPCGKRLFPESEPLPFLLFNPGSPTDRRHAPRCSFGLMTVEDGAVRAELVWL
jgi:putative phosphoesterase